MEITIKEKGNSFLVSVEEGNSKTEHTVSVPDDYYMTLTEGKVSKEDCLRASFSFLLEREPKEMILRHFDLPVIQSYFPEFPTQFNRYL